MGLKESGLRGSVRNVSTGIGAAITIDTLEAENVDVDSATIRGEITELTNFGEDAEVFFEWGETTQGLPNTTDIQLQDTVGVFTEDLTNLSEDTTHEFQAFGSVRDVSDDGVVLTFETGAAITDSVHDYDEIANLDDYDEATSGAKGNYKIDDNPPVLFGDNSLKSESGSQGDDALIISFDGLNRYPERGDVFSFYQTMDDTSPEAPVVFCAQDFDNWYAIQARIDGTVRFYKDESRELDLDFDYGKNSEEWVEVEVSLLSNEIDFEVYEVDQSTGERESSLGSDTFNDDEYDNGGFGYWRDSTSNTGYIDNPKIIDEVD